MNRAHESLEERPTGSGGWRASRPRLPRWGVLAALWLVGPWWAWAQSNALNQATRTGGMPVRLGALRAEQLEEWKGRPLCVYNFTSW